MAHKRLAAVAVAAALLLAAANVATPAAAEGVEVERPGLMDRVKGFAAEHDPKAWIDSMRSRPRTTWERLFGGIKPETWVDWLGQKSADLYMHPRPHPSREARGALQYVFAAAQLGSAVFAHTMSNALEVALFCFDVLGLVLLWQVVRSAVLGEPVDDALVRRIAKVAYKSWRVVVGSEDAPEAERNRRMLLGLTVFSPLVVAGLTVIVLPAMLLAVATTEVVPLAVGMSITAIAHSLLNTPLSLFVNDTLLWGIINCYRIVVAGTIYALSHTAYQRLKAAPGGRGRGKINVYMMEEQTLVPTLGFPGFGMLTGGQTAGEAAEERRDVASESEGSGSEEDTGGRRQASRARAGSAARRRPARAAGRTGRRH